MISRFLRRATEFIWPFGAFQKTNDPHKAIENLERASGAATLWILGGIFVDIGVLLWFSHDRPERFVGVIANAAIGFGLVVEYLVVGRVIDATKEAERESNERIAKIEERTAEANDRAAQAELKLEELKKQVGPRQIDSMALAREIAGKPKMPVEVLYVKDDPDSFHLAIGISNCLNEANWEVMCAVPIKPDIYDERPLPSAVVAGGHPSGVTVVGPMGLWPDGPTINWRDSNFRHTPFTALARALEVALGGSINSTAAVTNPPGRLRVVVGPRR